MRTILLLCSMTTALSACAVHPQTQDFSRDFMPEIVSKVRCEARSAISETFGEVPEMRGIVAAFDFDFIMTENNDATSKGSVVIPIHLGAFSIGWAAGAERTRKTTQELKFEESFGELLDIRYCDLPKNANYRYPITGSIGLKGTFDNFSRVLKLRENKKISGFFDEVEFTTFINGSITPKIELAPRVGRKITAEATLVADRSDLHRVKLTFTLPSRPPRAKPLQVQIVDEQGRVIVPGAAPEAVPEARKRSFVPTESLEERKARARQKADDAELQRTLEDIQRELNRR